MERDILSLKKIGHYHNGKVQESSNALYANGYSLRENDGLVKEFYDEVFAEINRMVNVLPTETVLDIGCGTGEILFRLSNLAKNVIGIDLSEEMVKLASQKKLKVLLYNGGILPFDKNKFDCVVINHVYINLPSSKIARNLIEEANRVIKKGGRILLGGIPHSEKSLFPTHAGNWRKHLKKLLGLQQPIHYFSYKYSFFLKEFDKLGYSQISYFSCKIQLDGWDSRYHVLLKN
jgi:ubiquinone/menaquinone biosynthesis C-methylase UbiE